MEGDGAVSTRGLKASIDRSAVVAEVLDELESQEVAVEAQGSRHVFHVNHGVVEGEFAVGGGCEGWCGFRGLGLRSRFLRGDFRELCSLDFRLRFGGLRGNLLRCFFRGSVRHTRLSHVCVFERGKYGKWLHECQATSRNPVLSGCLFDWAIAVFLEPVELFAHLDLSVPWVLIERVAFVGKDE